MPDDTTAAAGSGLLGPSAVEYFFSPLLSGAAMSFQNLQSAFSVSAAANTAALSTIPPLSVDDFVDRLTLFLRGANGNATVDQAVTVSLYACNTRPATTTEAANGEKLLDAISVPLVPILTATGVYSHMVSLTLPLAVVIDPRTLHLALVVTGPSGAAAAGVAFLGVQRAAPES